MEIWIAGGGCRCVDAEASRYGALETRCKRSGVEVWRPRVGVQTRKHGSVEAWRSRALKAIYRRVDVEAWRYRALEARCGCVVVEVSSAGGVLKVEARCRWRHGGMEVSRRSTGVATRRLWMYEALNVLCRWEGKVTVEDSEKTR